MNSTKIVNFRETFHKKIRPELQKKFGFSSIMAVPEIKKLVINVGIGAAVTDKKHITDAIAEFTEITGQRPTTTYAKKSIAGFKLREGMPIGIKITLRKDKMYAFMFRLIHIIFPRIRDFRGLPENAFDQNGNYNIGLREQVIFPEVDYDKIKLNKGMNLTFVIKTKSVNDSRVLLKALGFPLRSAN